MGFLNKLACQLTVVAAKHTSLTFGSIAIDGKGEYDAMQIEGTLSTRYHQVHCSD